MALTGLTNLQPLHIKTVGIGTFDNAVSIGGTLTYEDVTNVDAIGIITARSGINVSGGQLDVGSNIKLGNAGVITATSFVGSGSGLTGLNSDLVNDSSPQLGGMLDSNGNNIKVSDNDIIVVGTGNDLQISHSSNISRLRGATTNDIHIESAANFKVRHQDTDGSNAEDMLICTGDGAVELYHNGTKRFETSSTGVHVDGELIIDGVVGDLKLNSSGAEIDFNRVGPCNLIMSGSGTFNILGGTPGSADTLAKFIPNGAVELYHNNSKKFDTVTTGIRVHGDEGGTAQLQLLADQGDDNPDYWRFIAETDGTLNMQDYGSGNWYNNIRLTGDTGGVILFQNNDAKFQTQSDGVRVEDGGHLYLHNDSENSSSYIRNTDSSNNSNIAFYTREGGSGSIRWNVTKSGQFIPNANNTYDIGDTTNRVRNIYTNDLNLSNKGSTNSVDNTWGDYTIQEGESDLYLINNRNGKKYKFNLTEVS